MCVLSRGDRGACDSEVEAAKEEVGGRSGRGWSTLPQWEGGGEDAPPSPFLARGEVFPSWEGEMQDLGEVGLWGPGRV